uniref:Type I modular polyketide synthase n=1 Tax=Nocardiopsis sp. CMB-M0232 TaxID=1231934 RepID=A0A0D5BUZ7_9ACTN|nr:type I modular polyketide synthase [Nocardiopsis sp. CMB-M0232]
MGIGCRFPGGVRSAEDLWRLLEEGTDTIGAPPADRGWDEAFPPPDRARVGGFLYDGQEFDAGFFGISPREAVAMDPQQRLLLETAWEAVESAGIAPDSLKGSRTGVFAGTTSQDYAEVAATDPEAAAGFGLTGSVASVLSGRVSYALGLEGPAVTIDTACSSSLVAIHLAVQALRRGECDYALAGGAAFMSTPNVFAEFSRQGGLAADGRCKSFAGAADGTGWGEGVGLVLVERLSDALRNGHEVLAVVRGSAVNQDGASNGLTAPNGPSQQRVIRSALADAGLETGDVDVVEAHGTGTVLGDPIEAQALLATYGRDRPADRPLHLGSVKSNIGHTQAAAGVAGVIKMVMALRHRALPRTLHVDEPSPKVDWSSGGLSLLTEPVAWPEGERLRRAGVSSFGISGTNAHLLLEQAPAPAAAGDAPPPDAQGDAAEPETEPATAPAIEAAAVPWVLSAKSAESLRGQAGRLLAAMREREAPAPIDVGWSLAATRARFDHRAVVTGSTPAELLDGLSCLAEGRGSAAVASGRAEPGGTALVFSGQGAQWPGMARGLYASSEVFRSAFDEVCAILDPLVPGSLAEVVFAGAGTAEAALLDRTDFTQPALFAVEVALHALVRACGVRADVVAGHSVGEIAAAHVAGVLSLRDACVLVAARGRLMAALPSTGAMLSLEADEATAAGLVEGLAEVGIGAVNGPASVVVSGDAAGIDEVHTRALDAGIRSTRLRVGQGFHSPLMDPMLDEFAAVLRTLEFRPPRVRMVSAVTGEVLGDEVATPLYWVRHARETVRYHDAVRTLAAEGIRTLVEVGPDGVLSGLQRPADLAAVPLMRRPRAAEAAVPEADRFIRALAQAHARGANVDWRPLLGGGRTVALPTYAFDRKRFWIDPVATGSTEDAADARLWRLVERGDVDGVARVLDVGDEVDVAGLVPALSSWRRRRRIEDEARSWCYGVSWTPATAAGGVAGRRWLVVTSTGVPAPDPAAALAGNGARVVECALDGAVPDRSALAARLAEACGGEPVDGVLSLLALDEGHDAAHAAVLVQALGDAGVGGRLWCVTRGAVSAGTAVSAPEQAGIWGLGRVIALEHPDRWGGLIDLPSRPDGRTLDMLCDVLGGVEDQVALRGAGVLARRLVRADTESRHQGWRPRGTVLLTGGTGALGRHVTRWLLEEGAGHVLVLSRRGPDAAGAADLVAEHGDRVSVVACDVAERGDVAAALARVPQELPLTAVVHAAGVPADAPVDELSIGDIEAVARPKVAGAWNLHDLTRDLGLDAFVMFSSGAGVVGAGGLGAYGAANAFLDGFAEYRRGLGLPATAVAWGAWAGGGMAVEADATEVLRAQGMRAMEPDLALAALRQVLDGGRTAAYVADLDWDRFAATFTVTRPTTLFAEVVGGRPAPPADTQGTARLTGLSDAERRREVRELVRAEAAAVLGHADVGAVDDDRPFRDLGFDSLTAVELRDRIAAHTGLDLSAATVFDHPTVPALAGHIIDRLGGPVAPQPEDEAPRTRTADEPVAIVGIGCRYPGGVASADDLWRLVAGGADAIGAFPADRGWNVAGQGGEPYARVGGFLYDGQEFDPGFFGISPREAVAMDPQQRLLLETAWEAIESAGIAPDSLKGSATGVFAGTTSQDYAEVAATDPEAAAGFGLTGSVASVLSGRVSYALGLEGPAMTVDTACSSSLVALHMAVQALRRGECDYALAGGATFMATPGVFAEFSRQGGLAADGRCKSFAGAADGTGWGEGAGLVFLERLSDARRNGHEVLAVVRGSAVNQDGASNGLTAPNGPSQQRVIRRALADAGLEAGDVDAVEAHGTGTTLGDPIEAQALLVAYGRDRSADRPLRLGSVKSNIGHTQAAAGVAGVIKMVMALRNERLPKTLHAQEPTSRVDWSAGAVSLLTDAVEWPQGDRPRRAGVSSFGISGTNAHVIIEEAPEPTRHPAEGTAPVLTGGPVPWVLSAKTPQALQGQAQRLLSAAGMLDPRGGALTDVAWSLATTRSRFGHRAVIAGTDHAHLLEGLSAVAEGRGSARVVSGRSVPGRVAFVFSGQGAQWPGMARGLYESSSVFADAFNGVCAAFDGLVPGSLAEVVFAGAGTAEAALLDRTDFTQPALFAVEVALHALVRACGVRADVVAGHSVGEIAAAHVAGVLSLRDACVLVAARGRLMAALPSTGAMLSVEADEATAAGLVEGLADVGIGAVNAPASVVVSGDAAGIDEVATRAFDAGIGSTRLRVGQGFHSPLMDPMLDEFAAVVAELDLRAPDIPLVSTVTGSGVSAEEVTSHAYWVRHARETVRYHDAVRTLVAEGVRTLVEIGPDGVLSALAAADDDGPVSVALVRRPRPSEAAVPEPVRFVEGLAKAHTAGVDVDWAAVLGSGHRVALPTYAFDRRRYWIDPVVTPPSVGEDDARLWNAVDRDDAAGVARVLDADEADVTGLLPMLSDWRRRRLRENETRGWRYGVSWTPVVPVGGVTGGRWLVVVPPGNGTGAGTTVRDCVVDLAGRAAEVHEVEALADRPALAARLAEACGGEPVDGVLSLLALDEGHDAAHLAVLVQALGDADVGGRLWCVTQGAVSAGAVVSAPDQAGLWGLGRVIALEHPDRWGGLIDLPSRVDGRTLDVLCRVLGGVEDQVALRGAGALARRLVRANAAGTHQGWRPRGTVLLTGGTGGLGRHVTRWLLEEGAEHVLVLSRRGPDTAGAAALVAEHRDRVTVVACDVADRDQLAAALTRVPEGSTLRAVVHAAGVVGEGPVDAVTAADFAFMARPKAVAAWHLHELTRDLDLDAFVMFSSGSGVVGAGGLAAYGAANAFLDGFAEYRHGLGLPATAVAWGAWAGDGMAVAADATEVLRAQGMRAMAPASALAALRQVLDAGQVAAYAADLDWDRFAATFTIARPSTLFNELVIDGKPEDAPSPEAAWTALPEGDRDRFARELVRAEAAAVLGHADVGAVDDDRPFRDLGFDSLTAVELRDRIAARTGLRLTAAAVFDHPTPAVLAAHLLSRLTDSAPASTAAVAPPHAAGEADEAVAIVGIGCRYPGGVASAEELWRLVADGVDAVGAFPGDRGWAEGADGSHVRAGGFLYDGQEFDAGFFGISPREALAMDPQQRLLLETAWEAVESAGIAPDSLKGSRTGVFAGTTSQDYAAVAAANPEAVAGFGLTGSVASVLSGRVAYALGLEGPAVTIDTACSSSLVALHMAVQALRRGECDYALAGGVTFMSTPGVFTEFHRQQGLAGDGRCKSFSDGADGTGFSEGVGLLVVERLSDALRNGHEVLAVVRGSAVNQDGASNGLTAPNGPSQQRVIRAALADAGLGTGDVDAVEAHGTGTKLGDPIEAEALVATYGTDRPADRPLRLGSVKSNIGHTQAAAGVAGVIKMVMALRHGRLPRSLHIGEPSPAVDWSAGAVSLLTEPVEWPQGGRLRRAGVSSFGISGTNAHLILEEPPASAAHGTAPEIAPLLCGGPVPWVLSAKSGESLQGQAGRLLASVRERAEVSAVDTAWSLAGTRARFDHRAVVVGSDRHELVDGLAELAAGRGSARVVSGRSVPGRVAFVFSGQGAQWPGMARGLYESSSVFADAFNGVCAAFDGLVPGSLAEVVFAGAGTAEAALLDRTDFTQPALFAVEVALHALVRACGVRADVVAGHSVGEIAAAHVAGVLSLRDACVLVAARGRLMAALPSTGAMLSVEADEATAAGLVEGLADVGIGAVNAPASVVVSGAVAGVDAVETRAREAGIGSTRLRVGQGFHSPLMDPMLEEFAVVVAELDLRAPSVPVVSTVTGRRLSAEEVTSHAYWVHHARETVRYHDAVRTLVAEGVRTLVEIGPDGVLSALAAADDDGPVSVALVRRPRPSEAAVPEPVRFVEGLAKAHTAGVDVDWAAVLGSGHRVALPTYAFDRRRYWIDPAPGAAADVAGVGLLSAGHPLLGAMVESPGADGVICTARLSPATHAWLADHTVAGSVVVPGTAVVEMVGRAGDEVGCGRIGELILHAPMTLPDRGALQVRVVVGAPDEDGERDVTVHSRPEPTPHTETAAWTGHAAGIVTAAPDAVSAPLGQWPPADATALDLDGLYPRLEAEGLDYGPAFRGLRSVWRREGKIFAEVELPEDQHASAEGFLLHPALLDAALHALGGAAGEGAGGGARLPFSWTGVRVRAVGATALRVRIALLGDDTVSLEAFDTTGRPVADVEELALRPLALSSIAAAGAVPPDSLFSVDWTAAAPVARMGAPRTWAVLDGGDELAGHLRAHGAEAALVTDVGALAVDADGAPVPDAVVWRCPPAAAGEVPAAAHEAAAATLSVVRRWLTEPRLERSRLVVITRNAVAARDGEAPDPSLAPVWGLVRSAQSEHPDRFVLVDLDAGGVEAIVDAVASGEPQVAVRGGEVLVPRVVRFDGGDLPVPADGSDWRLGVRGPGTIDDLAILPAEGTDRPLGAGEVRVRVRAAGINFRDVLMVLGMYPGEISLGSEGAGVVTEIGPGVADIRVGDRVAGYLSDAFAPVAIADHRTLAAIPQTWSWRRAASMPVVSVTALYGLRDLAGLSEGESVLVHAGAGGVGMAAIAVARHLGAEVFATASEAKWGVLRGLGLDDDHIASSRTLDFEHKFLKVTGGRGVDVVLNSLSGEFVDASLRLLPRGGRFIEIGKRDIRDAGDVAAAYPGVRYRAFDSIEAGPERIGRMLTELVDLYDTGALHPLPASARPLSRAREAFRGLSQATHVGKLVLTLPERPLSSGTVLITGGSGHLASVVARQAAQNGAGHVLLLSRRGPDAPGARPLREELERSGTRVTIAACDVADRDALAAAVRAVPSRYPLRSVVHTAGVLDDGVLDSLTPERLATVFRPKVTAAWHLHELTRDHDLDAFVLFSSVAGVAGGAGQGGYAAANTFLDALAQYRHALGLPATSLAWGPWAEDGMAAGLGGADRARVTRSGLTALSDDEGLRLLDTALRHEDAVSIAARLDPAALTGSGALWSSLAPVSARRTATGTRPPSATTPARLGHLPPKERLTALEDLVRTEAAAVLGHPDPGALTHDRPFRDIGFDSLTAVELRNRLNTLTGLRLPPSTVFDFPTVAALADHLEETLFRSEAADAAGDGDDLDRLDTLLAAIADRGEDSVLEGARQRMRDFLRRDEDAHGDPDDGYLSEVMNSASFSDLKNLMDEQFGYGDIAGPADGSIRHEGVDDV